MNGFVLLEFLVLSFAHRSTISLPVVPRNPAHNSSVSGSTTTNPEGHSFKLIP